MSKVLYDTKFLQLKETVSQSGKPWYYAHRPNAEDVVVILPVTSDEVLFLIEKRPPLFAEGKGEFSVSLPAGLVGDVRKGETVEEAIKAELKEEAGLAADRIKINVNKVSGSSGCISETCVIATAYIEDKKEISKPIDDGGIIVDRIWVKKSEVKQWLNDKNKEGYVISAHTLAALLYLYWEDEK